MKLRYFAPFLASAALVFSATAAFSEPGVNQSKKVFCSAKNGTPTTVALNKDGTQIPIFHWNSESISSAIDPQQECHEVASKLNNYVNSGRNLSSFQVHDQQGLPAICAEETVGRCSATLMTFDPKTTTLADANSLLDNILDNQLKTKKAVSNQRGVQGTRYEVDLWSLLGWKFWSK